MSDEERGEVMEHKIYSSVFKEGQLQIVEVTPFEKNDGTAEILPDLDNSNSSQEKSRYMEVVNQDKSVMHLDLLNMTLVRCDDSTDGNTYQLVANADTSSEMTSDATVCVLQTSDNEDTDNQDSIVVMNGEQGPLMFLQPDTLQMKTHTQADKKSENKEKALTPVEILEKAKALQKVKTLMSLDSNAKNQKRLKKRKSDLPPTHELLNSPNFKLFLYSCKMCSFKCNAIKEMTAHKAAEHSSGSKMRGSGRPPVPLQCARCPYKGSTHMQLMRHVQERHSKSHNVVKLADKGLDGQTLLVCGACGFESGSRAVFKNHIQNEHGATTD